MLCCLRKYSICVQYWPQHKIHTSCNKSIICTDSSCSNSNKAIHSVAPSPVSLAARQFHKTRDQFLALTRAFLGEMKEFCIILFTGPEWSQTLGSVYLGSQVTGFYRVMRLSKVGFLFSLNVVFEQDRVRKQAQIPPNELEDIYC